jgi:hypothetical protein
MSSRKSERKVQRSKRWRFVDKKLASDAPAVRRFVARKVVVRGRVVDRELVSSNFVKM